MSFNFKTIAMAAAIGVCGLIIHQATHDANAIDAGVAAVGLPEIARHSSTAVSSKTKSAVSEPDSFKCLQDLLQSASAAAAAMPGYTAILEMQEEVNDTLRPVDRISVKIRREPFSVYMRWNDNGQEVLYVDGENDNRLIVKPTDGLAAIRRIWRLEPDCRMAKKNCRYPITDAGIEKLAKRIQEFYRQDHDWSSLATCESGESTFLGREVTVVNVEFKDKNKVPEYHRSKFCFDNQTQLLIAVDNYGWPNGGEPPLIEHYVYDQITEIPTLTDQDFTEANPGYQFVAR